MAKSMRRLNYNYQTKTIFAPPVGIEPASFP
jgi:hypothetical protein